MAVSVYACVRVCVYVCARAHVYVYILLEQSMHKILRIIKTLIIDYKIPGGAGNQSFQSSLIKSFSKFEIK